MTYSPFQSAVAVAQGVEVTKGAELLKLSK